MARIDVKINVSAPIDQCYRTLLHFENYREFISYIQQIDPKGQPDVWQWSVQYPGQLPLKWDLEIQGGKHQHNSISWHTIRDADIAHSGAITLKELDNQTTSLHFVVEYKSYSGGMPNELNVIRIIEECLENIKYYIEQGRPAYAAPKV